MTTIIINPPLTYSNSGMHDVFQDGLLVACCPSLNDANRVAEALQIAADLKRFVVDHGVMFKQQAG